MQTKAIQLVWITVKDFNQAVKFYTEVAGLKLLEKNEEWGWAELEGYEGTGMKLGIAKHSPENPDPVQPGQNGVFTLTVANLEQANQDMVKKGATLVGKVQEVPGHVKLQTVRDREGNVFQLVEQLHAEKHHANDMKKGCCAH